jgi:hypothetical protein
MGEVVDERQFAEHAAALAWAVEGVAEDDEIQRVEFLGPEGDWRWADERRERVSELSHDVHPTSM